jgi:hypothetical protein
MIGCRPSNQAAICAALRGSVSKVPMPEALRAYIDAEQL